MASVIAVMAPVGGGKSSLAARLGQELPGACSVHFDHYPLRAGRPEARDLGEWLRAGADPDAFVVAGLAGDLARLRRGETARDPATGAVLQAERHVLFETPFGRAHRATGRYVDLAIWVDVPLDVALARKLRQLAAEATRERLAGREPTGWPTWLETYLGNYLDVTGEAIRMRAERARAEADVVLPGDLGLDETVALARQSILERL